MTEDDYEVIFTQLKMRQEAYAAGKKKYEDVIAKAKAVIKEHERILYGGHIPSEVIDKASPPTITTETTSPLQEKIESVTLSPTKRKRGPQTLNKRTLIEDIVIVLKQVDKPINTAEIYKKLLEMGRIFSEKTTDPIGSVRFSCSYSCRLNGPIKKFKSENRMVLYGLRVWKEKEEAKPISKNPPTNHPFVSLPSSGIKRVFGKKSHDINKNTLAEDIKIVLKKNGVPMTAIEIYQELLKEGRVFNVTSGQKHVSVSSQLAKTDQKEGPIRAIGQKGYCKTFGLAEWLKVEEKVAPKREPQPLNNKKAVQKKWWGIK